MTQVVRLVTLTLHAHPVIKGSELIVYPNARPVAPRTAFHAPYWMFARSVMTGTTCKIKIKPVLFCNPANIPKIVVVTPATINFL